jgi:hypothetical protein
VSENVSDKLKIREIKVKNVSEKFVSDKVEIREIDTWWQSMEPHVHEDSCMAAICSK